MILTIEVEREITGYHQLTSLGSAVKCPGVGSVVTLQAKVAPIRYRPDDVDPTGTVGFNVAVNESHTINMGDGNISKLRIIQASPGAEVNIIAFK